MRDADRGTMSGQDEFEPETDPELVVTTGLDIELDPEFAFAPEIESDPFVTTGLAWAPAPDTEPEIEPEKNEGPKQQNEDNSGKGSGEESSTVEETKTPEPEFEPKNESLSGTVNSMDSNVWDVSGIPMDVSSAEIKGTPSVGASVKVEGYYDANGIFIVTKLEFESSGSGIDNSSSSNDISNNNDSTNSSGSNDNSGSNSNDSHDDSNHNSNDSSGGGSGSGGDD